MHSSYSVKPRVYRQSILCKLIDLNKILDTFKIKILKEGKHTNSHIPEITILDKELSSSLSYEGKKIRWRDL